MTDTDKSTYAPFTLLDTGKHRSLLLSADHMMAKVLPPIPECATVPTFDCAT